MIPYKDRLQAMEDLEIAAETVRRITAQLPPPVARCIACADGDPDRAMGCAFLNVNPSCRDGHAFKVWYDDEDYRGIVEEPARTA